MLSILKKSKKIQFIAAASIIFLGFTALYFYKSYEELISSKIDQYSETSKHSFIQSEKHFLDKYRESLNTNLLMSQSQVFNRYINEPTSEHKTLLFNAWHELSHQKQLFKQVRYLDITGQEQLRINSHDKDMEGNSSIDETLQNKAHRNYFLFAQTLRPGSIGVFGIDLEQEHHQYTRPYTPALRIIIPIFKNDLALGYIITNYDISTLLSLLTYRPDNSLVPEILSADGSYIIAKDKDHTFGNELPSRKKYNLPESNPKLWQYISENNSGSYYYNKTLYLFHRLTIDSMYEKKQLIALEKISLELIKNQLSLAIDKIIINFILIAIAVISALLLYIHHIKQQHQRTEYKLLSCALNHTSAIAITNKNFTILKGNQEFIHNCMHSEEDLLNHNITDFLTKNTLDLFFRTIKPHLIKHGVWQGDISALNKDEHEATYLLQIQSVKNSDARYIFSFTNITQRKKREDKLKEHSERDPLTNSWNRRLFDLHLKKEISLVQRYGSHYRSCLAFIDLDHFKRVNDKYGHQKGDWVLIEVVKIFNDGFRETDFISRIGGEEFAVILPQINIEEAYIVLERIRENVKAHFEMNITISIGLIAFTPELTECDIYKACDDLLYQAKRSGRNQTIKKTT